MSTAPATPSPAPKRSKLLIVSLAFNLLVLGLAGGAVFVRHRAGGPLDLIAGRMAGDPGLRGFLHTLPKERHATLRKLLEPAQAAAKPLRQAAQAARMEVAAAWNEVPINPARIERAMGDVAGAEMAARKAGLAVLMAAIENMTPEERRLFQSFRKLHERDPPHQPGAQPPQADTPQSAPAPNPKN